MAETARTGGVIPDTSPLGTSERGGFVGGVLELNTIPQAFIMAGRRTADGVWVSWTVYGSPDGTGASYTGGALTIDSIYVAG